MDVGFKTDKGKMRMNNEDAFFVMKNDGIFIIADGVGGTSSGEIASHTAVNEVAQYFEDKPLNVDDEMGICTELLAAVKKANFRVYDTSQRYSANRGMATTMVIACVRGSDVYICNVGDSRAYIFDGVELTQISEDHTYVNELVKAGVISRAEAKNHTDKNMITKAIGAESDIDPDFFHTIINKGDALILCTDGLYGEVSDHEMEQVLLDGEDMSEVCENLVKKANDNGGHDNITVICARFGEDDI